MQSAPSPIGEVSIPSSSGHQFTAGPSAWTAGAAKKSFQSLLHQGISLLCVNGFRVSFANNYVSIPSSSGHQFTVEAFFMTTVYRIICFNPFFIRASVYCKHLVLIKSADTLMVSIPSSSGHQFTGSIFAVKNMAQARRFNPFFIRASVYCRRPAQPARPADPGFQSLLHQGISLLRTVGRVPALT